MDSSSTRHRRALMFVALGAFMISFAPILVKQLSREGIGPTPIAMWRVLFASAMLFGLAKLRWRTLSLPRRPLLFAILAGVTFAGDLFVWHRSIILIGAGMATILGNTQVFWTSTLGWILYRERPSMRFGIAALLAFAGVALLAGVGSEISFDSSYLSGVGLGLATGIIYAGYIVTLRHSARGDDRPDDASARAALPPLAQATLVLAWVTLISGLCLAAAAIGEGEPMTPPGGIALALLFALALGVQVLAWLAISSSLPLVPAARAALVLLIQPAAATLLGALIFGEHLVALQWLGAGVTLAAVYLGSRA